ncbi:hypothetical protein HY970_02915 [Candidatus Kaiserbacteria bacterium]|nr:hypothetical protein [Candidatus Kaiserbacteria bacterium]
MRHGALHALRRILLIALVSILAVFICATLVHAQQGSGAQLQNPVRYPDITQFLAGALRVMVMIALPIISLFIVYSGFLFVAARGNEGKLTEAKQNFVYVIIGATLILGAWVLATLIGGTVSQLTG